MILRENMIELTSEEFLLGSLQPRLLEFLDWYSHSPVIHAVGEGESTAILQAHVRRSFFIHVHVHVHVSMYLQELTDLPTEGQEAPGELETAVHSWLPNPCGEWGGGSHDYCCWLCY